MVYIIVLAALQISGVDTEDQQIKWLFTCWISSWTLGFLCTLINLKYPLMVIKQHQSNHTNFGDTSSEFNDSKIMQQYTTMQELKDCLSDYDGYKLFMQHLVQEFACENLLFLTGTDV